MNDESSQSDRRMAESGVHYVRTQAMCLGFKIPLEGEFSDDTPEDEYILVMDGIYPVSTCRLHYLDEHTGKIERVATLESYRGKHYGQAGIIEAENWMREKGVTKSNINSRKADTWSSMKARLYRRFFTGKRLRRV